MDNRRHGVYISRVGSALLVSELSVWVWVVFEVKPTPMFKKNRSKAPSPEVQSWKTRLGRQKFGSGCFETHGLIMASLANGDSQA